MKLIGRVILWIGIGFAAIAAAAILASPFARTQLGPVFLFLGAIGFNLLIFGVVISLVAWVAEGFLTGSRPPAP